MFPPTMDRQALAGHIFNLLGYSREIHDLVSDELGVVLDAPIAGVVKAEDGKVVVVTGYDGKVFRVTVTEEDERVSEVQGCV